MAQKRGRVWRTCSGRMPTGVLAWSLRAFFHGWLWKQRKKDGFYDGNSMVSICFDSFLKAGVRTVGSWSNVVDCYVLPHFVWQHVATMFRKPALAGAMEQWEGLGCAGGWDAKDRMKSASGDFCCHLILFDTRRWILSIWVRMRVSKHRKFPMGYPRGVSRTQWWFDLFLLEILRDGSSTRFVCLVFAMLITANQLGQHKHA